MLLVPSVRLGCLLFFGVQTVYTPLSLTTLRTDSLCEEQIKGISDQRKTSEPSEDYRGLQICMYLGTLVFSY